MAPEAPPNADPGGQADGSVQGIDFSSFVISLATTAMVHLGEGPVDSGAPPEDLDAAGQMIDILGMLEKKTEGNLSPGGVAARPRHSLRAEDEVPVQEEGRQALMRVTFLGTALHEAIPVIGCGCEVCKSHNPETATPNFCSH